MVKGDVSVSSSTIFSNQLERAIKKIQIGALTLKEVPHELCFGEKIDLCRWSTLLTDENLDFISSHASTKEKHYFIDASKSSLREIFSTFWFPSYSLSGILSFRAAGAKNITDFGITKIARNCSNLKELDISGCVQLTDVTLREIGLNCQHLLKLSISSCHGIDGTGLVAVSECCPNLLKLNLSRCKNLERWAISKVFYECKKLEEVDVSHLPIVADEEIRVLAQSSPRLLSLLAIDSPSISDTAILALSQHCPDLDLLDVSRREMTYKITDVGMLALGQRSNSLRVLRVNGCEHITDVGLSWLAQGCRALEELDLGGCGKISDAGLRSIGDSCHTLTSIDISRDRMISDIGLASISAGCPLLKRINCSGLYLLADPRITPYRKKGELKTDDSWNSVIGVPAVAKYCQELYSLDVSGCFRLNIALHKHLAKRSKTLRRLNLSGCNQITTESLVAVAQGCTLLEELLLADCGNSVSSVAMSAFSKCCREMKTLVLTRCINIKASAIRAISNFPLLEKLDLTGCIALEDESLLPICETDKLIHLRHISLAECPRITDTGLAWLASAFENLLLVAMKGSSVTRHATRAVRESFPYSDMIYNQNFVGFWPKPQVEDRVMMYRYEKMSEGFCQLQGRVRIMIAKRIVNQIKEIIRLDHAVRVLQRVVQVIIGKNILRRKRAEMINRNHKAEIITSIFRLKVAKNKVQRMRNEIYIALRNAMATKIQRFWGHYLDYKAMLKAKAEYEERLKMRYAAACIIQAGARMFFSRRYAYMLRTHQEAHERLRVRKAAFIQRVYRGHVDRETVRMLREQKEYERQCRRQASITIQKGWRNSRTRLRIKEAEKLRHRKHMSAIRIQAVVRGRLARWEMLLVLTALHGNKRDWAALRIQTTWRVKKAYLITAELRRKALDLFEKKTAAANILIRNYRKWQAQKELSRLRSAYMERIRSRVLAEFNGAIKIQAAYRGMKGRIYFKECLRRRKGQWKELFDEEKGMRFFYNKLTGEIRWRMPQDLLDLIPRPVCDNCSFYEAATECEVCNEVFCEECWNQIHYGGRRKEHTFRALYDYYGKRIDYGDSEYPCKWPTEIIQNEIQGWMLRVAPIRDPVETIGEWEKYHEVEATDGQNVTSWKEFYFNRGTFEASYEPPPGYLTGTYTNTNNFQRSQSSPTRNNDTNEYQLNNSVTFDNTSISTNPFNDYSYSNDDNYTPYTSRNNNMSKKQQQGAGAGAGSTHHTHTHHTHNKSASSLSGLFNSNNNNNVGGKGNIGFSYPLSLDISGLESVTGLSTSNSSASYLGDKKTVIIPKKKK